MAIDTRNRRASCLNFLVGSGRVYPNPDGSISSQDDRQHVAGTYPGILAAMGMITTRDCRASCICLDLGFGRVFPNPDGSITAADNRRQIANKYCRIESVATPGTAGSSAFGNRSLRPHRFRQYQSVTAPVVPPDFLTEETTIDRYEIGWRTPVWKRRQPIHTPGSFIDDSVIPPDPTAQNERPWYVELSRPVLPKFRAYYYPWSLLDLEPNQQAEAVSVDRFHTPLSEPFFPILARYVSHYYPYDGRIYEPSVLAETVFVQSFEAPLSLPVRPRRQPIFFPIGLLDLEPNQQPETILVCAYESGWARPVFFRIPVRKYLDGLQITPELFATTLTVLKNPMLSAGFMNF